MKKIGPAVASGAVSTSLAMAPLVVSDDFACFVFFRIFVLVIAFGAYNGLVTLPIMLSLVGPTTLVEKEQESQDEGTIRP